VRFELVDKLPEDLWQAFVDAHPASSIFHTPAMQAVFARSSDYEPLLRAAVSADGRVLALLTATGVRLAAGPLSRLTSRAIAYGGLLCVPGEEGQVALAALLRWHGQTSKHRFLFTEFRHRSDASSWRETMSGCGYEHEPELNFLVNIGRPVNDIWQGLNRTARKNVKRAKRDGLVVQEVNTPGELVEFYELLQQVYAAAHVPLADISLFRAAFEQLSPRGAARFVLARTPKGVAGARVVLLHNGTVFDWYAGADREMRKSRPNDFLVWRTLAWGANNGYHTFDFGGAGHPDVPYGVRDFKAKFGGQLVNYGRDRQAHSPGLLRIGEAAYGLLRRFL